MAKNYMIHCPHFRKRLVPLALIFIGLWTWYGRELYWHAYYENPSYSGCMHKPVFSLPRSSCNDPLACHLTGSSTTLKLGFIEGWESIACRHGVCRLHKGVQGSIYTLIVGVLTEESYQKRVIRANREALEYVIGFEYGHATAISQYNQMVDRLGGREELRITAEDFHEDLNMARKYNGMCRVSASWVVEEEQAPNQ